MLSSQSKVGITSSNSIVGSKKKKTKTSFIKKGHGSSKNNNRMGVGAADRSSNSNTANSLQ